MRHVELFGMKVIVTKRKYIQTGDLTCKELTEYGPYINHELNTPRFSLFAYLQFCILRHRRLNLNA